jgi:tetratricopeptide (TPR) repeat protein
MPAPVTDPAAPASRRAILSCAAALTLATLAAYHNSFAVPLLFDDIPSVASNPSILHLWPIWDVLNPAGGHGYTFSGRPVLNLSLALCYAVSGTNVWSYHALNVLIHLGAALTLFGIVRRTLQLHSRSVPAAAGRVARPPPRDTDSAASGLSAGDLAAATGAALQSNATPVAFTIALLWALHPLQTESVTYIVQRAESLMGLFFLLTFYGFIRAVESPRPRGWQIFTVAACLLGVATKEVAATAPVLVLLYDRTFVAGTFREAWRRRRWLHLALAATWLPLLSLVAGTGWNRGGTAGFDVGVPPWAYWLTQFRAVVHYVKQSFWPHPLVFEYGVFQAGLADAAPYALVVVPLAAATLVALWRWPVIGFLGAWFFVILAPTSLLPSKVQMIVEHRMYLPLAAVIALTVGAFAARAGRRSLPVVLALAVAAGVLTERRNQTYRSDLSLWSDTVARSPGSAAAQLGLGTALYQRGRLQEALTHYEISLQLDPSSLTIHYNLGLTLLRLNRQQEAAAQFTEECRLHPRFYAPRFELGLTQLLMDQPQAAEQFEQVVRINPTFAEAHYEWGVALAKLGRSAEAIPHYRDALRLRPDYAEAECDLGVALYQLNRAPEAAACFQRALHAQPDLADAHFNLAMALAQMGRSDDALTQYTEAARLNPDGVGYQLNLGIALARADRVAEALDHLQKAVQLQPALAQAHCNLGIALAESGRAETAVVEFQEALRLRPDYAVAHYSMGNALITLHRLPEARRHFEEALRVDPNFDPAREMLDRFRALPDAP